MKATRILIPFVLSMASLALAQDVTGDWHGTLSVNGAELRLVLHISKNSDGSLKATLDSIDQNANGIPVTSATLRGSALSLKVDAVHGWYELACAHATDGSRRHPNHSPICADHTTRCLS